MQELKTYVDQIFDSQSRDIAEIREEYKAIRADNIQLKFENERIKAVLCELRPDAEFCD